MAVRFEEGERWYDNSPFIGQRWMYPVYMIKDEEKYFVIHRAEPDNYTSASQREAILQQLADNDGAYATFYSFYKTPFELLSAVCERKYSFEKFSLGMFRKNVGGSVDFCGNLREVSAAFKYRIYDSRMLENVKRIVSLIKRKRFEDALVQIEDAVKSS